MKVLMGPGALIRTLSTFLLSSLIATQAFGHGSTEMESEGAIKELVSHSNLIFVGRVLDVDYQQERMPGDITHKEGREGEVLPVTYVTYSIERVLRGKQVSKTMTLRFLGGPDGQGRFLTISGVPRFQQKETDVLFVEGNGAEGCPLVNCEHGRFRVLDGGLYDAFGVAIQAIVDQGLIARGQTAKEFLTFRYPAPTFDDLIKLPQAREIMKSMGMSEERARERFNRDAPKEIVVSRDAPEISDSAKREVEFNLGKADDRAIPESEEPLLPNPIAVEEFLEAVSKLSEEIGGEIRGVESIEPGQAKFVGYTQARPAPTIQKRSTTVDELESLQENDGNPVLK